MIATTDLPTNARRSTCVHELEFDDVVEPTEWLSAEQLMCA